MRRYGQEFVTLGREVELHIHRTEHGPVYSLVRVLSAEPSGAWADAVVICTADQGREGNCIAEHGGRFFYAWRS